MYACNAKMKYRLVLICLGLVIAAVAPASAAEDGDVDLKIKARAISALSIERATADLLDIRITRRSTAAEREMLVGTLQAKGNRALADALVAEEEVGWVRFDPRGGRGPGRDPRKTTLRYAREIVLDDTMEVILLTNHYIGYGLDPLAANGAKLAEFPLSFVLLKLQKDAKGEWKGIGRMFVGAKVRFDSVAGKFVIDEFPNDPVYLKDVTVK